MKFFIGHGDQNGRNLEHLEHWNYDRLTSESVYPLAYLTWTLIHLLTAY